MKNLLFLASSFGLGIGKGAAVYIHHYFHYMIIILFRNPTKLTVYVKVSQISNSLSFPFFYYLNKI